MLDNSIAAYGLAEFAPDSFGDEFSLIETPFSLGRTMKRSRYDDIDAVSQTVGFQFIRQFSAEGVIGVAANAVFRSAIAGRTLSLYRNAAVKLLAPFTEKLPL